MDNDIKRQPKISSPSSELADKHSNLAAVKTSSPKITRFIKKQLKLFKEHQLVTGLIILVIVGGILSWFFIFNKSVPIPDYILKSANFQLYYPASLPKGWQINPNSWSTRQGVVLFTVNDNLNHTYAITEQPFPTGLSVQDFNSQNLTTPTTVVTNYGQGVIGKLNNTLIASLSTKIWILISAPTGSNVNNLQTIINTLKPS